MQCGNCGQETPLPGGKCPHCGASPAQQEYFHAPANKKSAPSPAPSPKKRRSAAASQRKSNPAPFPAKRRKPKQPSRYRSKILFVLMFFWCIAALGVFSAYLSSYSDDNRYLQTGETFVQALVLQDNATLLNCIHEDMHGFLHPQDYDSAVNCEAHGIMGEEADAAALQEELTEHYNLRETVVAARWVLVEYTVERQDQIAYCSIEVLLANIGGDIYAVKTRNLINIP